jgi:hypothetical protein
MVIFQPNLLFPILSLSLDWLEEYLGDGNNTRQEKWTESIAVGGRAFVEKMKELLDIRAKGRDVLEGAGGYQLRNEPAPYKAFFDAEKGIIDPESTYFWNVSS